MSEDLTHLEGFQFVQTRVGDGEHKVNLSGHPISDAVSLIQVNDRARVFRTAPTWVVDEMCRDILHLPVDAVTSLPSFHTLRDAKIYAMDLLVRRDAERRLDKQPGLL